MPASSGKPTWAVRVRNAEGEPSRDVHVAARSILQAEAIVRRHGSKVIEGATRRVEREPDPEHTLLAAAPGPLHCPQCGYHLDGLIVRNAIVECPECGHPEVLTPFRLHVQQSWGEPTIGALRFLSIVFRAIGIVAVLVIVFAIFVSSL